VQYDLNCVESANQPANHYEIQNAAERMFEYEWWIIQSTFDIQVGLWCYCCDKIL